MLVSSNLRPQTCNAWSVAPSGKYRWKLLTAVDQCMNRYLWHIFAPMTFKLTRWPSFMNLTRIPWRYTGSAKMNFRCQGFRKLLSDRHTYRQTERCPQKYIPCLFTVGEKLCRIIAEVINIHGSGCRACVWKCVYLVVWCVFLILWTFSCVCFCDSLYYRVYIIECSDFRILLEAISNCKKHLYYSQYIF